MTSPQIPFAAQRVVFLALVFGLLVFMGVIAVLQNSGQPVAATPIPVLDTVSIALGAVTAVGAFAVRGPLHRQADAQPPTARGLARFRAHLVPLAILEGGALFALVTWLLNGNAVPSLVVANLLLAMMIAILPLRDPDAGAGAE